MAEYPRPGSAFSAYSVLAATAFILPPLAMLAANGLAPLSLLTAVALLAAEPRRIVERIPRPLAAALAALLVLGLASLGWTIVPTHSIQKVGQLFFLFAAGLIAIAGASLIEPNRRPDLGWWLASGIAAALVIFYAIRLTALVAPAAEGTFWGNLQDHTHFKRGAGLLVLAAGPACYSLWRRARIAAAAALAAAVAVTTLADHSGSAQLAAAMTVLAGALALHAPRSVRTALIAGLIVLFAAAPLMRYAPREVPETVHGPVIKYHLNEVNSILHRMIIWQFTADRIADRPLLGWGLDSSRALPGGKEKAGGDMERLPLHPHDAILQVWVELGLFGALIGAWIAVWPLLRLGAAGASPAAEAMATAVAAGLAVLALIGWGIWQSWWVAEIWLVAALTAAMLDRTDAAGPA